MDSRPDLSSRCGVLVTISESGHELSESGSLGPMFCRTGSAFGHDSSYLHKLDDGPRMHGVPLVICSISTSWPQWLSTSMSRFAQKVASWNGRGSRASMWLCLDLQCQLRGRIDSGEKGLRRARSMPLIGTPLSRKHYCS